MKHTKKKVTKIIEEMITFCYSIEATEIETSIKQDDDAYYLHIKSNYNKDYTERLNDVGKHLNKDRNVDFEEMYWNIAGMSDMEDECEMTMVASMTDHAEVQIDDQSVNIYLTRKRHKRKDA